MVGVGHEFANAAPAVECEFDLFRFFDAVAVALLDWHRFLIAVLHLLGEALLCLLHGTVFTRHDYCTFDPHELVHL